MLAATCDICRFEAAAYTVADVRGTISNAPDRWRWTVEHLPAETLGRRPEPTVRSLTEYATHTAGVISLHTQLLRAVVAGTHAPVAVGDHLAVTADDSPAEESFASVMARLAAAADELDHVVGRCTGDVWDRVVRVDGASVDTATFVRHTAHEIEHHLRDAGRIVAALTAGTTPGSPGAVAGLFQSVGGVPKQPIAAADIRYRGVVGDRQAARQHHGRVWQALCLWSADVIDQLRAEGHPIFPGAAGENVTVQGVDWRAIRPGVRLGIGPEVVAEVTAFTAPCSKNAAWFVDRHWQRMEHDRHPGSSRVYAAVLRDGIVRVGDAVVIEP